MQAAVNKQSIRSKYAPPPKKEMLKAIDNRKSEMNLAEIQYQDKLKRCPSHPPVEQSIITQLGDILRFFYCVNLLGFRQCAQKATNFPLKLRSPDWRAKSW